jgi:glucosyl-dolichyl phosphate glucuronosyltransferase
MIKHTIIIPTAGRPLTIEKAIQSVLKQDLARHSAELIIVDNNTDETLAIELANYCNQRAGKLRYIREPSPGLGAARHRGAMEAYGEWLTFLDDDVEVTSSWLPALNQAFVRPNVVLLGGPSIPKFTESIPEWFFDYFIPTPYGGWMNTWLSLLDIGRDIENIDPNYIWGLNFSIRKKVLFDLGGFHPDIVPKQFQRWQGDGETGLTMKVKGFGLRADYVHNARLLHLCGPDRLTTDYFKKRAFYQGVCNSFTSIRSGHEPLSIEKPQFNTSLYLRIRQLVGKLLRRTGWRQSPWFKQSYSVKLLTQKAILEGWKFHQVEAANDPELLAWIRRTDYLNTDLREIQKNQK